MIPKAASSQASPHRHARRRGRLPALLAHPLVAGALALLWLVLRSGRKPTRLAYPCQRAALSGVSLALGLALVPGLVRAAAWLAGRRTRLAATGAMLAALALGGLGDTSTGQSAARRSLRGPADYRATVFDVVDARGRSGDHHLGVDALLRLMGAHGLKLHRSPTAGALSGPAGLIGPDDVVLVKVNQQWSMRGGTNTDVLMGLIASLLEHPDGFHGEIVVVENGQGVGSFDWPESNAEDHGQSTLDVVNHFAGAGRPVSCYLWDSIKDGAVGEYSTGDLEDGYVIGPWDADAQIRVSYPKFRTAGGRYVSLRDGIWDPVSATYDTTRLKFITVPVLKCHVSAGVTGAVKIHVGTMTTGLSTNTHAAVSHGGIGAFLAQVRRPDLNVLDCTYVLADPDDGPACDYAMATRVDQLVAGQDPVALDLWAVSHVLVPTMLANGYASFPKQDPADPASAFRTYLDRTAIRLLAAGIPTTNDLAYVDAFVSDPAAVERAPADPRAGAYPNPFVGRTTVRLAPRRAGEARLDVYDASGRLRRSIVAPVRAGVACEIPWDGRDAAGRAVDPGTYFYRVNGAGTPLAGRVTRLR